MANRDPVADLRRIAFLLERAHEATYRVRAFRGAATSLASVPTEEIAARAAAGTLTQIAGVGAVTARCVVESLAGEEPVYLRRLVDTAGTDLDEATAALRAALKGDCHSHSDWSDGGSPIEEMVAAAIELGHEYLVLTDHSPRLTVARGLDADRLRKQLDVVAAINDGLAGVPLERPFRLLTGIEVDILADGGLDQEDELLARLDVVVGSVHSGLKDDAAVMTRRMVKALENPHLDILGHCTGRLLPRSEQPATSAAPPDPEAAAKEKEKRGGRGGERGRRGGGNGRAESTFDADAVFATAAGHDKAIEINSRPERLDPPKRLLRKALEAGCRFTIDTDAHAPGQLDWQRFGCERAIACAVPPERIVNTWSLDDLLAWTRGHEGG
ncbi:PHP domain-containing protein [Virgisporangium aurantiacum]|uniref:PHP domain-containing protein n=1 Tax=Virgisporangium aurantiacum TaxID=175570 RepID=A0A8J3Z9I8_9ACTN|nr:PHP domain-containing protein [Virgisporangium aurantiacum]GIJ59881.1 PHP domain-containing protein [Virgisporangium aurantiacum]